MIWVRFPAEVLFLSSPLNIEQLWGSPHQPTNSVE